jgi:hypothetical protein
MRSQVLPVLCLLASPVLFATPAQAGGLGVIANGGLHEELVYYYTDLGNQGLDVQHKPNYGGGLEVLMGDRDARVQGAARLYYMADVPQEAPDVGKLDIPDTNYAFRDVTRNIGVVTTGVYWGILGDPEKLELNLNTFIGAGTFTVDNSEFILGEAGVGGKYALNDHFQVFANVAAAVRYRKGFFGSGNSYLGVRYLFD